MSLSPCLAAALGYLQRGWSVLPLCPPNHFGVGKAHAQTCAAPGKAPALPWKKYQSELPTEDDVKAWWQQNPHYNVGCALGEISGLVGLDIDGGEGEEALKTLSGGDVPATLEFVTPGGGRRLLFAIPEGVSVPITKLSGKKHEELRLLAAGAQTVMPPSRHRSGGTYEWEPGHEPGYLEPAHMPGWLIDHVKTQAKTPQSGHGLNGCAPTHAPQIEAGSRNVALASMAGAMRRKGVSEEGILAALWVENQRCQPPLADEEVRKIAKSIAKYAPEAINAQTLSRAARVLDLEKVTVEKVEWLWRNWIALGKIAILDGDPDLGKSTLLLDIAARVSRGWAMPDGSAGNPPGTVLLMTAEDGVSDTIKPRLMAAGADLARVRALEAVKEADGERPFMIPEDLDVIEEEVKTHKARLVIIDPLMAFLGGVDSCKDQDVRKALYRVKQLAERTGAAVIAQRHLNKGGAGGKAIYRGGGSIGIIGAARTGALVAEDPDDEHCRVLASQKNNLGPRPRSLRYRLEPLPEGVCRVAWLGESDHKADKLVAQAEGEEEKGAVAEACTVLEEILEQGPQTVPAIKAQTAQAGLAWRTVERAKKKLNVKSFKDGFGGEGSWKWKLPHQE